MAKPLPADHLLRNRYRLRKVIGHGGMGAIYLAEDERLTGRLCALKEIEHDPSLPRATTKEAHEQFYREASVLARLDHPNLPKVSDFFSTNGRDYLVMDYVAGKDLRELMNEARAQNTTLPLEQVLGWFSQLLDALQYMHNQDPPIVHRDIKPSNIKVTPIGVVKLVDFGLVKLLVPDEMTITVVQGRGTALYTPLEQYGADTGHTDTRSDIYSLSATLYHLLTNSPPAEAKQRFLSPDALVPPRRLNPDIPASVEHALLWGMALHPDDRPANIDAFREALFLGAEIPASRSNDRSWEFPNQGLQAWDGALLGAIGLLLLLAIFRALLP
ncbi:MAG: serine/threonine-protein kinase [Anaerolineales bacterium]|jgi:serine/threonine-protein kinase